MVKTRKLLGILDSHHVLDILDDTNSGHVAMRVATDGAHVTVADVMAHAATLNFKLHLLDGMRQFLYILSILPQQVQHQSQGRLASHARQLCKLLHGPFQ